MLNPTNNFKDFIPDEFPDVVGKHNDPAATVLNTRVAIKKLGVKTGFDEFHVEYLLQGGPLGKQRQQAADPVLRRLDEIISLNYKFSPGEKHMATAVKRACESHPFHPIKKYLEGLKWDRVPRIDNWLHMYMGAADTPFIHAVSRITLLASVTRIYEPGAQFDYITVLVSPEGYNKTTALRTLYGDANYTDQSILGLDPKQVEEILRGMWGVECSEIAGMRKGDLDKIKSQVSRRKDRVRRVWDAFMTNAQRTAVLWGSTNDFSFLKALSGENRRFFTVVVGRILLDLLTADRDQLWAEAFDRYCLGTESIMLPEALWGDARAERDKHTQDDPWLDKLQEAATLAAHEMQQRAASRATLLKRGGVPGPALLPVYAETEDKQRVASAFLIDTVIGVPIERQTAEVFKRISLCMSELGWVGPKAMRLGEGRAKGYERAVPEPF